MSPGSKQPPGCANHLLPAQVPTVFADRDGTLIDEVNYLRDLDQIRLIRGVASAVRRLNTAGIPLVVTTNQSAVARGIINERFVMDSATHLKRLLAAEGAQFCGHFYCPHHPEGKSPYNIVCDCRKPASGMVIRARDELGIKTEGAWMVGDKLSDLQIGADLGLVPILVRTGYGQQTERGLPLDFRMRGGWIFEDFPSAIAALLGPAA